MSLNYTHKLLDENLQTLTEAAQTGPVRRHVSSLVRWAKKGVRGVRLETIKIAGRRFTSKEAMRRFVLATTVAADGIVGANRIPPEVSNEIENELDRVGL